MDNKNKTKKTDGVTCCTGRGCQWKELCYRYHKAQNFKHSPIKETFFDGPVEGDGKNCEYFFYYDEEV